MKTFWIEKEFAYDGSQLRSLFAYLGFGLLGPSIVSWRGACAIPKEHMVDGEDLLANERIEGAEMLHFIIEVFDRDLFSGVGLQRLFASIAKDYLQINSSVLQGNSSLSREGDDIYWGDRKLSISIATKSPLSTLVHFAMNITNEGTPVKTLALRDLEMEPLSVANELMSLFKKEYDSMVLATQKVRAVP